MTNATGMPMNNVWPRAWVTSGVKIALNDKVLSPVIWYIAMNRKPMPNSMNTSATRVVMKALTAAPRGVILLGSGYVRAYQNPISRYEHKPMISQPMKSSNRLSATTNVSIAPANSERKAKKRVYI